MKSFAASTFERMIMISTISRRLLLLAVAVTPIACMAPAALAFDLQFTLQDNSNGFTAAERVLVQEAVDRAEAMWESVITGYQNGASIASVPITVIPTTSGLAAASFSGTTQMGGFTYSTAGFVNINVNEIENFADWQGVGANGKNYLDELIAHEVGHVLGIGTLWTTNGLYSNGTYQYTGVHGVAAYQAEFTPPSNFVPVENNGGPGTPNAHWDQMMRSSGEAGDPNGPGGPWVLSPLTGVVDNFGRDRAFELMTGAIDPDYYEPYLSRTTVESMRDLGYTVAAAGDFNADGVVNAADGNLILANLGATGLQIDSMIYGDFNGDRAITTADYGAWARATGVPEPGALVLAGVAVAVAAAASRRRLG
ncbi:MAG: hypothetical protein KDA44_07060 [Planctomycetales bacterium]|nr:hypothetical protein [Planctomycetales bacterium]